MIIRPNTKTILMESFLELETTMPIDKITISDITNNCNVRRETFYRHFLDKDDLINAIYMNYVQNPAMEDFGKVSLREIIRRGYEFLKNHPALTKTAFKEKGPGNFNEHLSQTIAHEIEKKILQLHHLDHFTESQRLTLHCYVSGGAVLAIEWFNSGFALPVDVIVDATVNAIPFSLKKFYNLSDY